MEPINYNDNNQLNLEANAAPHASNQPIVETALRALNESNTVTDMTQFIVKELLLRAKIKEEEKELTLKQFILKKIMELIPEFKQVDAKKAEFLLRIVNLINKEESRDHLNELITGVLDLKTWNPDYSPLVTLLKYREKHQDLVGTLLDPSYTLKDTTHKPKKVLTVLAKVFDIHALAFDSYLQLAVQMQKKLESSNRDLKAGLASQQVRKLKRKDKKVHFTPLPDKVQLRDEDKVRDFLRMVTGLKKRFDLFKQTLSAHFERMTLDSFSPVELLHTMDQTLSILRNYQLFIDLQLFKLTKGAESLNELVKEGLCVIKEEKEEYDKERITRQFEQSFLLLKQSISQLTSLMAITENHADINQVGDSLQNPFLSPIHPNTNSPNHLFSEKNRLTTHIVSKISEETSLEYESLIRNSILLRELKRKFFSALIDDLKDLRAEIAPDVAVSKGRQLWIFLGDEICQEEEKASNLVTPSERHSKRSFTPKSVKAVKENTSPAPSSPTTTPSSYSKPVQDALIEAAKNVMLRHPDPKIKIYYKELRDHVFSLKWNFEFLIQACEKGDFQAIAIALPEMVLHAHLQIEQFLKFKALVKFNKAPIHHSLLNLAKTLDFYSSLDQPLRRFLTDLDRGMENARYPISAEDHFKSLSYSSELPRHLKAILAGKRIVSQLMSEERRIDDAAKIDLKFILEYACEVYISSQKLLEILLKASGELKDFEPSANSEPLVLRMQQVIEGLKGLNGFNEIKTNPQSLHLQRAEDRLKEFVSADSKQEHLFGDPQIPLKEAQFELLRLRAAFSLKESYSAPQFTALHLKNTLGFQRLFEQILAAYGILYDLGDLRWIPHHDLIKRCEFLELQLVSEGISRFNLGRKLHYAEERSIQLPLHQQFLQAMKVARHAEFTKVSKEKRAPLNFDKIFHSNMQIGLDTTNELLKIVLGAS
jgi:uncharacterized membrane-anchored protein YjiN (DUF445 family)